MTQNAVQREFGSSFLGAPAVYYCDIAHGKPRLVLAYLAELTLSPYRGLGLVARTQLDDDELACMDAIGRRLLARPFDYLHGECGRVRRTASPGFAIAALSASHCTALQIAPPRDTGMPPTLVRAQGPCTAAVLGGLGDMLQAHEGMGESVATAAFCEAI